MAGLEGKQNCVRLGPTECQACAASVTRPACQGPGCNALPVCCTQSLGLLIWFCYSIFRCLPVVLGFKAQQIAVGCAPALEVHWQALLNKRPGLLVHSCGELHAQRPRRENLPHSSKLLWQGLP